MANLELEVEVLANETAKITSNPDSVLGLEIDLGNTMMTGEVLEVEYVEVTLPEKVGLADTVHNYGGVPGIVLLEAGQNTPPPGTPTGVLTFQKA